MMTDCVTKKRGNWSRLAIDRKPRPINEFNIFLYYTSFGYPTLPCRDHPVIGVVMQSPSMARARINRRRRMHSNPFYR